MDEVKYPELYLSAAAETQDNNLNFFYLLNTIHRKGSFFQPDFFHECNITWLFAQILQTRLHLQVSN